MKRSNCLWSFSTTQIKQQAVPGCCAPRSPPAFFCTHWRVLAHLPDPEQNIKEAHTHTRTKHKTKQPNQNKTTADKQQKTYNSNHGQPSKDETFLLAILAPDEVPYVGVTVRAEQVSAGSLEELLLKVNPTDFKAVVAAHGLCYGLHPRGMTK